MSSLFSLPPSLCAAFPKATQLQTTRIFLCVAFDIQTDRVTAYLQTTEVPISLWIFPVWPHKPTYLQRPSCLALHTAHWLLHGLPQSSARFSSCHVLSTHTNCMDYLLGCLKGLLAYDLSAHTNCMDYLLGCPKGLLAYDRLHTSTVWIIYCNNSIANLPLFCKKRPQKNNLLPLFVPAHQTPF